MIHEGHGGIWFRLVVKIEIINGGLAFYHMIRGDG